MLETGALHIATRLISDCEVKPCERVCLVCDEGTVSDLRDVITAAASSAGARPLTIDAGARLRAFAELAKSILDEILSPGLVIDLTTNSWLYSDSLHRYSAAAKEAGSRLALLLVDQNGYETFLRCPPDDALFARAAAFFPTLSSASRLKLISPAGTDFEVELTGTAYSLGNAPREAGAISAPLYASVSTPFKPGTANGVLAFSGAGRVQGPVVQPFFSKEVVLIEVRDGYVQSIEGDGEVAGILREWRSSAPSPEVDRAMDCNVGFDPRGVLEAADNQVVHCYEGGVMIGFGSPYEYRPKGSLKPGFHLDLLFTDINVELDGVSVIESGRFVERRGLHS